MKFNWGTGITLAIVGFISFIMYFVVSMSTDKKMAHDLVTEEYYKKELDFQGRLDRELNAQNLVENISIEKTAAGLLIRFPEDLEFQNIEGHVFLYRPSNKQLDVEIPLSLSSHQMLIPEKHLLAGRWNIEINWNYFEENYFFKEELTY